MAYQVFLSHTKDDRKFLDDFDRVVARVGLKAFRSEFETIGMPQWRTIKEAMTESIAMFLLVGEQLAARQIAHTPGWEHTQNWIAYETGLACQTGIDVWVYCDKVEINFPVPYFNNYALFGLDTKRNFEFLKRILTRYNDGQTFPVPTWNRNTHCPWEDCGIEFNLHATLSPGKVIKCPQCLRDIIYKKGFLTNKS